jgi:type IV pilus assembly protein PilC
MPIYKWEGKTRQGVIKKGEMDAPNDNAVMDKLRAQQISPIKVKPKGKGDFTLFEFGSSVTEKDIVIFTRQFATMIDAGLPLVQCLDILINQQDNRTFAKVLSEVKEDVESGSTFARALGKHPKVFDSLFVSLIAAGEVGGILDTILNRLGAYIEKAMKLKKQVKGAMVYPAAITGISILVVMVLLIWVIPVFREMFKDFGSQLPAPTQFVCDISDFVKSKGFIFGGLPCIFGFIYGFKRVLKTEKGRAVFDSVILRLPVVGDLVRKVAVAKFTRTLGTMITSGVPILDSLEIVAKTAGNKTVENAVLKTRGRISEGKTIAEPLAESNVFPPMVVQMITVGESTGALDVMLSKIADFYEDEVDQTVEALTTLLEPIMMVFLGGLVGGMLVAMYLPIFKLAGAMSH